MVNFPMFLINEVFYSENKANRNLFKAHTKWFFPALAWNTVNKDQNQNPSNPYPFLIKYICDCGAISLVSHLYPYDIK